MASISMESLMALIPPILFEPSVEKHADDEQEVIRGLNEAFDITFKRTSEDYGHAVRSVHAKTHGTLHGELIVADGLSEELTQGRFAKPGRHEVYMRMSTNAGDILADDIRLPRGLALKVLGVAGERMADAEGDTQDFVTVNGPVFQAPIAAKFLGNLKLLAKTTDRLESTKEALSALLRGISAALGAVGIQSTAINSIGGAPNVDPLGETYYSTKPFQYGNYIAKFSIVPISPSLTDLTGAIIDASDRPNVIRETVQQEMQAIDATWEFRVQLRRDLDRQPVEYPTVRWDEADTPFHPAATINVRSQDSWSPETVQAVNEEMRFSVWTGLAAHQPLATSIALGKTPTATQPIFERSSTAARSTSPPTRMLGADPARPRSPNRCTFIFRNGVHSGTSDAIPRSIFAKHSTNQENIHVQSCPTDFQA